MFEVFLRYVHPSRWHRVGIVTYRFSIFSWGCKQSNLSSFVIRPQIYNFLFILPNVDFLFMLFCVVPEVLNCGLSFLSSQCVVCSKKVTGCFVKSDGLFCEKWRVVLWKVTGRFVKSDRSFCGKWRVVFNARWEGQKKWEKRSSNNWVCGNVKIPINCLARAHVYARTTGVFVFLLSQVSQVWGN